MTPEWAQRQRDTNRLVRLLAGYIFDGREVTPAQLFGLCKLTWITDSFEGDHPAYVASTKIPALEKVMGKDYSEWSLEEVAEDIADQVGPEARAAGMTHTGFTNFYKAYRNRVEQWLDDHFEEVRPLFEAAYRKADDDDGAAIIAAAEQLPGIPKKGREKKNRMAPARLLTPVFFALDPQLRFPLINGNKGVTNLLRKLKAHNAGLQEQYRRMISVYGQHGINDAADLDQAGHDPDLPDFLSIEGKEPLRKRLERKPTEDRSLPLKDESDIESLQESRSVTCRRLHNQMTNQLSKLLSGKFQLDEGVRKDALFDVSIKNYDGEGHELFVEVKSSVESAHLRMAVGQLFSYWFTVKGDRTPHLALLLPSEPEREVKDWLDWLEIGLLWFDGKALRTGTKWLRQLCVADAAVAV